MDAKPDAVFCLAHFAVDAITPELFRFGASTLLNDVLMQIVKTADGGYQSSDYFALS